MRNDPRKSFSRNLRCLNVLRVASAVAHLETVTFAGRVFRADNRSTPPTVAGELAVALNSYATAASRALTIASGQNAVANETVTIAGVVYTFKSLAATANDVLIGADNAATAANLAAAINAGAGAGTAYGTGTVANPSVSAAAASNVVTVTARIPGTVGNSLTISETMSQGSWASAATALAGGADSSAANFTTALVAAIAADSSQRVAATRISANEVLFEDLSATASVAAACTETLAGSNNAWASANTFGGEVTNGIPDSMIQTRAATAVEVALGTMHFLFPFTPTRFIVQARTSAGATKYITSLVTVSGRRLTITADGATVLAATDVVTVQASQ